MKRRERIRSIALWSFLVGAVSTIVANELDFCAAMLITLLALAVVLVLSA